MFSCVMAGAPKRVTVSRPEQWRFDYSEESHRRQSRWEIRGFHLGRVEPRVDRRHERPSGRRSTPTVPVRTPVGRSAAIRRARVLTLGIRSYLIESGIDETLSTPKMARGDIQ